MFKLRKYAPAEVKTALDRLSGKDGHPRAKAFAAALEVETLAAARKGKEALAALDRGVDAWGEGAPPMDLRFYHDGLGQDTHEKQRQGLEITYEDYEPGFGTASGVARTSEMMLSFLPTTPSRDRIVELAEALSKPPVIIATPQTLSEAGVFGGTFSLPSSASKTKQQVEQKLAWLFDFYQRQQDEPVAAG